MIAPQLAHPDAGTAVAVDELDGVDDRIAVERDAEFELVKLDAALDKNEIIDEFCNKDDVIIILDPVPEATDCEIELDNTMVDDGL